MWLSVTLTSLTRPCWPLSVQCRIHYWKLTDGRIELAKVGVRDQMDA